MNDNQRLFAAIALSVAIYVGWQTFVAPKPVPHRPAASAKAEVPAPAPVAAAAETGRAPVAAAPAGASAPRLPTRQATLQNARARAVVTTDGAAIHSFELLGDKFTVHKQGTEPEHQVELVKPAAGEPPGFATAVLRADGSVVVPADASYELVRADAAAVELRASANGVTVTKKISLDPNTYGVHLDLAVQSAAALEGRVEVSFASPSSEPQGGFFSRSSGVPARAICEVPGKAHRVTVGDKEPTFLATNALFAGVDEQYFLTAVAAPAGVASSCALDAKKLGEKQGAVLARLSTPFSAGPGRPAALALTGYAGPKDTDELAAVAAPLRESVDLGFFGVIANLLLGIMRFFHRVVPGHNWGVAIILLTLAMKLLTFPLQHKSMKSMQEMSRLQPQLEEMKKKYAGDQQRQNLEQMKLFREHGVNPMGSCLPMLIQMPIWFALYTTLQVSVELYNAPFIRGWLSDLTAKDPFYVLPIAMGATMILTQVLTPTPMSNPSQKQMGYVMSAVFSVFMISLPSGLTLYIFTNNVLSILQQMYLRRTLRTPPPPASGQVVSMGRGAGAQA